MVDSVERLGIDRHFKNEIKSALDYVYRSVTVALASLFVMDYVSRSVTVALASYGIHMIITCSYWSEKGIGCGRESVVTDLNSSALGFRALRLHGYPVSSGRYMHILLVNRWFVDICTFY
jgi:hypothetical protein